ncbi:Leucine aminopeptidase 1 [Emydomyces testavorans]|uniref:Peptide hydrolase n=1 Tax=Emydomyces testavorans TaxID=2070801 RepID=A0AAF0DLH4_9EURO|nr:Leucine aminopeptidase 1 [Emydomyces testavorans]
MKTLAILALTALASPSVWGLRPAAQPGKFLIETARGETRWVTENEKFELKSSDAWTDGHPALKKHIDFFDITQEPDPETIEQVVVQFPSQLKYVQEAKALASKLSKDTMRKDLEKFSSFHNRFYNSPNGLQSANWLFDQVTAVLRNSGAMQHGATVNKFMHSFQQPSIIATIPGKSKNIVVVGAHQDSINQRDRMNGRAPGADDDGSGSITILDALRALLSSPKIAQGEADNTIEFHWYAGEEGGLLGSQDIFRKYRTDNKPVKAMLNQDMTGYTQRRTDAGLPEAFGMIMDNVDPALVAFAKLIVKGYTDITSVDTNCGYACSDHASANRNGFPSIFVFEADFQHDNPQIHTAGDTIDLINFDHVIQHGKLIIGFVYELAFASL